MTKRPQAILLTLLLASPLLFSFYPEANRFEIIRQTAPLLVLGVGILAWLFFRGAKDNAKPTSLPLLILLLGFLFTSTLSWISSDIQSFGFAEVFVLWLCSLVYLSFSQEKDWGRKVMKALSLTLILATVLGVAAYLNTDHTRFFGFFYDPDIKADAWPNAYADFFLMSFPFFVLNTFEDHWTKLSKKWKWPSWMILSQAVLVSAFLLSGFILTASRGAFLALIPGLFFLCLVFLKRRQRFHLSKAVLSILAVAALSMVLVSGLTDLKNKNSQAVDLGERLSFTETEGGNSFGERLEFFEGALALIKENPLLGTGPSSFRFAYQPHQQGFLALSDHPHNLWLKLAAERGIPSALLLLSFLAYLFYKTQPLQKRSEQDQTLTLAAWTGLLALLAHQMIDYNLNFVTNALSFWLILGVLASQISKQKSHQKPSSRLALLSILAVSTLVAGTGLKLTYDERNFNGLETLEQIEAFHPLLPAYEWYEKIGSIEDPALKMAFIQKQLEANPMDSNAWSLLGQEKEKGGDLDAAREAYQSALEVDPKNSFLHYLQLAQVLVLQKDWTSLEALTEQMTPLFEEYQELYDLNLHYTQGTKEMEYLEGLKTILTTQP